MEPAAKFNSPFVWMICVVSAMGGLLFGYDWVVVGGARMFYEPFFGLETSDQAWWRGFTASSALYGCLVGAWASGRLTDRYGRKPPLIASGLLFTASAIWTALANDLVSFNIARVLGGIGIGLASNLSPLYIAEVSPASRRGQFVSINQLTIVIGVLAAQIVNQLIGGGIEAGADAEAIRAGWYGQSAWRWMFAAETIPALSFFLLMFLIPESPRWLGKAGRWDEARRVLARVGGDKHADDEVKAIQQSLESDRNTAGSAASALFGPKLRPLLVLGVTLAVFQQWCGINAIFYYAPEIFQAAGQDISDTFRSIAYTGVVNLVATIIALPLVDRIGRRPLMLFGAGSLTVIYAVLAYFYSQGSEGPHMIGLVLAAIGCYALSLAPVTWVLIAEIFPTRVRGAAVSLAVLALWAACAALAQLFPILNEELGTAALFGVFAAICAAGFLFLVLRLPETSNRSLEELERQLADG